VSDERPEGHESVKVSTLFGWPHKIKLSRKSMVIAGIRRASDSNPELVHFHVILPGGKKAELYRDSNGWYLVQDE
jgi:hypothetical protein